MAGPRQTSADKAATPAVEIDGARVLVVEARFYDKYADELLAGAMAALEEAGCRVDVVTVPGALEIPIAIEIIRRQAAEGTRRADGFVALGVVIRGETTHYEIVSNESARELIALGTREALAFGNGILTVENHDQAEVRANPAKSDKGGDAARAALALYALKRGETR